jgi:hypothetical protein
MGGIRNTYDGRSSEAEEYTDKLVQEEIIRGDAMLL